MHACMAHIRDSKDQVDSYALHIGDQYVHFKVKIIALIKEVASSLILCGTMQVRWHKCGDLLYNSYILRMPQHFAKSPP